MKKTVFIPTVGIFNSKDKKILEKVIEQKWGAKPSMIGSAASPTAFSVFSFKAELDVPVFVIGAQFLYSNNLPIYEDIRKKHNCKVMIVLQNDKKEGDVSKKNNSPDFLFDISNPKTGISAVV